MHAREQHDQHQALIITGMHRSGTSLITQWLSACGLQVGEELLGKAKSNVDGHFEDLQFLDLHENVLSELGFPASGLCFTGAVTPSVYGKAKIAAVVAVKNQLYPQWGWKEPRTCLFLNTYKELLPSAKYLIVFRDYHAVVSSLLKREFELIEQEYLSRGRIKKLGWKLYRRKQRLEEYLNENSERYLKIWISYNTSILKAMETLKNDKYIFISYDVLKQKSPQVFKFLTEKWNFNLSYRGFLTIYKEKLISKIFDFKPYINDYSMIREADALNDQFFAKISSSGERMEA